MKVQRGVYVDEQLWRNFHLLSLQQNKTMSEIVEELVSQYCQENQHSVEFGRIDERLVRSDTTGGPNGQVTF